METSLSIGELMRQTQQGEAPPPPVTQANAQSARDYALTLWRRGHHTQCSAYLESQSSILENDLVALALRGLLDLHAAVDLDDLSKIHQLLLEEANRQSNPIHPIIYRFLGRYSARLGDDIAARHYYALAMIDDANDRHLWLDLASTALELGDFDLANQAVRKALLEDTNPHIPPDPLGFIRAGFILLELRQVKEGLSLAQHALELAPDDRQSQDFYLLLAKADLAESVKPDVSQRHYFPIPSRQYFSYGRFPWEVALWDGRQSLTGRKLLLSSDGDLADTLHYLRYLPALMQHQPQHIWLFLSHNLGDLKPLLNHWPSQITISTRLELAKEDIDCHESLSSLPRLIDRHLSQPTQSADGLIRPSDQRIQFWKNWLNAEMGMDWQTKPLIGLNLQANPLSHAAPRRSCDLTEFYENWGNIAGKVTANYLLLHPQPSTLEWRLANHWPELHTPASLLANLEDYAALLSLMKLTITIDDWLLPLSAMMGVPTWGLLPKLADIRWHDQGMNNPYYPHLRLYRQVIRREWLTNIRQMAQDFISAIG